jgi:hypothetical protein
MEKPMDTGNGIASRAHENGQAILKMASLSVNGLPMTKMEVFIR